jgi:hypothetical protein
MTLKERIVFMLANQNDLESEIHLLDFPEWNKGYKQALIDVLERMKEDDHVYDPGMPINCLRCATEISE